MQFSTAVRNARLDAAETAIGATAVLRIFSGAAPADCATADSGTLLVEMTLPADWMAAAATGSKAKAGTWSGTGDAGAGAGTNAGHWRIYESTGTTCHIQGDCGATSSGADMELVNVSIAASQPVTISSFTLADGNA